MVDQEHNIFINIQTRMKQMTGLNKLEKGMAKTMQYAAKYGLQQRKLNLLAKAMGKNRDQLTKKEKTLLKQNKLEVLTETAGMADLTERERKLVAARAMNAEQLAKMDELAKKFGLTTGNLRKGMQRENLVLQANGRFYDRQARREIKHEIAQKRINAATKRFRFELLSVMFFGQAVAQTMQNWLQPALQATGFFDVMGSMLTTVFLPFALWATKAVLGLWKVLSWPPLKAILNIVVPFLALVGAIAAALAQFGMLGPVLARLGGWFATAWPTITGFFSSLGGFGTAFVTIGSIIAAVFAIVVGAIRLVTGILQGDTWKIVSGIILAIVGIIALVLGGWIPALIALIVTAVIFLADKFSWLKKIIMTLFLPLKSIIELIKEIVGFFQGKGFSIENVTKRTLEGTYAGDLANSMGYNTKADDFIWRAGEGVTQINPGDNLIGTKGGLGGGMSFAPTINFNNPVISNTNAKDFAKQVLDVLYTELRRSGVR